MNLTRSSIIKKTIWANLLFFLLGLSAGAQSILYTLPESFSTCTPAEFGITITNNSGSLMENIIIEVDFPCEIEYAESLTGASEEDVSDLNKPSFSLDNIPAGASITFTFNALAPCSSQPCTDAQILQNTINLTSSAGTNSITTDPYDVEHPHLIIESVSPPVLAGQQGEIITRTITIRNTRLGFLTDFNLTDDYNDGIIINSDLGTGTTVGNTFKVTLSDDDFMTIGNHDAHFDYNETITITEEILITACYFDQNSVLSNISINWGCQEATCQTPSPSTNSLITILPNEEIVDDLTFKPLPTAPDCFCGPAGFQQGLVITNNSNIVVNDINIVLQQYFAESGIGENSIKQIINGVTSTADAFYTDETANTCNFTVSTFHRSLVNIASINALDSITLIWDVYFCTNDFCNTDINNWNYTYSYPKACAIPGSNFISGNGTASGISESTTSAVLGFEGEAIFDNEETKTMTYAVSSNLLLTTGSLSVNFTIPCGFEINNTHNWKLGNNSPETVSTEEIDGATIVNLTYELPISDITGDIRFDLTYDCSAVCEIQTCKDTIISSCPSVESCFPPPVLDASILSETIFNINSNCQDDCGIKNCQENTFLLNCENTDVCEKIIPGYAAYTQTFERTSLGLPDNNDDHIPDGTTFDFNHIRLDRALPSDTIRNTLNSIVNIDIEGTTFEYGLIEIALESGNQTFGTDAFDNFHNHLRIVDASTGTSYECSTLSPNPALADIFSFKIDAPTLIDAGCNIPADFIFDEGDSIIFISDFRININPRNTSGDPILKSVTANSNIYLNDTPTPIEELFSCGCSGKSITISGYHFPVSKGTFFIPPCKTSSYTGSDIFGFRLAEDNFFPYEHRGLAKLSNWKIKIDDHFSLKEANILYIKVCDSIILNNEVITPDAAGEFISFDLTSYQMPLLDEGFIFYIQYLFDADCHIDNNYPMTTMAQIDFTNQLLENSSSIILTETGNKLKTLKPVLFLNSTIPNSQTDNNTANWNINLTNSNIPPQDADYCWIYPTSATGLVDNFRLFRIDNGEEIIAVNGIFQIGTMPNDATLNFQLMATNNSCNVENIIIKYGWNCTTFTNPIQDHCNERIYQELRAYSSSGELEMNVKDPPSSVFDLCDTIPFYQLDIYNADKGTIYDLRLKVTVPEGIEIIPGSSEVSYPTTPVNFLAFTDPIDLGNNVFEWDISSLVDSIQTNGLVGILLDPKNRISIRFKSKTSCDYAAGSYFIFSASAQENCSEPTNTVTKPGDPIHITDVNADYTTTINAIPGVGPDCNDVLPISVDMQFSSSTTPSDSLHIILPDGIHYIAGSAGISIGEPDIQNNKLLWGLPSGLTSLDFIFRIEGFNDLSCDQMNLLFSTSSTANALCVADMDSCTVNVLTGNYTMGIDLEKPFYELTNLTGIASDTTTGALLDLSFELTNSGIIANPPINIALYLDTNHDGIFSEGDSFINQIPYQQNIHPGETITGQFANLNLASTDFCDIMVVVKNDENCACQTVFTKISAPIVFNHLDTRICSGDTLLLGNPSQAGHAYGWIPNDYLSCPNCAETDFVYDNDGDAPFEFNFMLNDSDDASCLIKNNYTVNVQPQLGIASNNREAVCTGNEITILATAGVSYNWTGTGITIPNQQYQNITVNESSVYSVTVTDAYGCTGDGSIAVTAAPLPSVDAGDDFMVCTSDNVFLDAIYDPDFRYSWSPGDVLIDSTIHNPQIYITETTTFHLSVWNGGHCFGSDDVTVTLNNEVTMNPPDDITICAGQTDTLTVTGDADTYEWSPTVNCLEADCNTVEVSPMTTTSYSIVGSTNEGCTDTVFVTVTIVTDTIHVFDTITVCGDTTVMIFGEPVSEPGSYCDTTTIGGDSCIEVQCIELIRNDTSLVQLTDEICEGDSYQFFGNILTTTGTYSEVLTNSNGCDSTIILNLSVHPTPTITFLPNELAVAEGDSLQLEISENFVNYSWLPADTTISCTDCPNPFVFPTIPTTYQVTVIDGNGCAGNDTILIKIKPRCITEDIIKSIPNIFSPNNDKKNDFFKIPKDDIDDLIISFEIWDRWGQKVFASNTNQGWDGNYKKMPAPVDTYFYTIKFKCSETEKQIHKGDVTLVR